MGRSLLVGGDEGPWRLALTDVELGSLDLALRSAFCDELRMRRLWLTPLDDQYAAPVVEEVMATMGLD